MSVTIHIPTPLRPFLENKATVTLEATGSIEDVLQELVSV